jgi:NAD(P)-dependent dehydrogenase (short-subunit alcohol dehydrogenase family)
MGVLERFSLAGRHAAVTGAGRGIGRRCATALAEAGADRVTVIGRTPAALEETAALVEAAGALAIVLVADVTDPAFLTETSALGDLDILVNNAGTNEPAPFLEVTEESFDRIFDLNVRSLYFLTQHAVRAMVTAGRPGAIVNLSSQMGHVGSPRRTVYCGSKHAVEGLTKALAVELAPLGIRVNSVAPTYVVTPLTEPFFEDDAFRGEVTASIPLGRLGTVDEVASAVVYLCSDAASLVTGTSLVVDGGWTAR